MSGWPWEWKLVHPWASCLLEILDLRWFVDPARFGSTGAPEDDTEIHGLGCADTVPAAAKATFWQRKTPWMMPHASHSELERADLVV